MGEPPDKETLNRLREGLQALERHDGQGPAHAEILTLARGVGSRVGVTIDRTAVPVLGQPLVVLREPSTPPPELASLTKRESEVARLVAKGFRNREIAELLKISIGTVKDHVHRILQKSGLGNRAEVAAVWRDG